jgi:hypothetical protein
MFMKIFRWFYKCWKAETKKCVAGFFRTDVHGYLHHIDRRSWKLRGIQKDADNRWWGRDIEVE